jgi:hypothetical protein
LADAQMTAADMTEGDGFDAAIRAAAAQPALEMPQTVQAEEELTEANLVDNPEIPQSMSEIYRISNRNRAKNRQKKKSRDSEGGPG